MAGAVADRPVPGTRVEQQDRYLGPHATADGMVFRVSAPDAYEVQIVGEWNGWRPAALSPMGDGVWEVSLVEPRPGQCYRYRLRTREGWVERLDPYSHEAEVPGPSLSRE